MFIFQYFHIPRTLSRSYCSRALQALEKVVKKPQQGIINLIVIDTEKMAQMNHQFRGKEWPTDILTFSYLEKIQNTKYNSSFVVNPEKNKVLLRRTERQNEGIFFTNNQQPTTNSQVVWEIYLCLEKIKLYAKERGVTYREQLEYIIIHGLIHLMGYDHETEEDEEEMAVLERKISQFLV